MSDVYPMKISKIVEYFPQFGRIWALKDMKNAKTKRKFSVAIQTHTASENLKDNVRQNIMSVGHHVR